MRSRLSTLIIGTAVLTACSDASSPTTISPLVSAESQGRALFQKFVAMGTSVSMGTQSDGTWAASQKQSWVAQLSRRAEAPMTLPLISGTGCRAPYAAPIISFKRTSGESVSTPTANLLCAALQEGITLPTQNVAIAAATTRDALQTTPETQKDLFYQKLYQLVLPPNTTQVGAMRQQAPKIVSVEFGANEVLPAVSGVAIIGVTLVPFTSWSPLYHALVDSVAMVTKKGLLVGLIHNVATFPGMRNGDEIWGDRTALLSAYNVAVAADCNGSANLVFVPARIPAAVAAGLTNRSKGLPAVPFSCSDGGLGVVDYVLTPAEAGVVNGLLAQMNAEVATIASQRGFARFELEALYGRADLKEPFKSVDVMTGANPYGRYISLDGIHPSNAGHSVLADAAVQALNATYNLTIPAAGFIAAR